MNATQLYGKRWLRFGIAAAIIVVGAGVMALLASTKEESNKRDLSTRVRQVEVMDIAYGPYTLKVHGNGTIESRRALDQVTLVGGQVVYSYGDLKAGMLVREGQTLLKIDDREAENRLVQARSGLINSIVSLIPDLKMDDKNAAYSKWTSYLEDLNVNSTTAELPAITDPQERIRVSMHNIFNQYSTVKNAEITLERHTIRAPFDAYVANDGAQLDTWVTPGQVVASLIDPVELEVAVPLAVSELELLKTANDPIASVMSTEDGSSVLVGQMRRQNTHIDARSQTVTVHVEFSNPDLLPGFLPGNYVDIHIEGHSLSAVELLPREVIAEGDYVYTFEDSVLGRSPVEILAAQGDSVVINPGVLNPGDLVVTTTLQKPIVGMRIGISDGDIETLDTVAIDPQQ